jgi:DNA-binding NarL/FixJ family response regulator
VLRDGAVSIGVAPRRRIRVLLADSHQLLSRALAVALGAAPDLEVVGVQPDLATAGLRRARPDVLVASYFLLLIRRAQLAAEWRAEFPELKIVVLTAALDEETVAACVQAGAVGCVTKHHSPAELIRSIRRAAAGEILFAPEVLVGLLRPAHRRASHPRAAPPSPTTRERQVLQALAEGLSTDEVAERMVISRHTVRSHLKNAMTKLEARTKLEAIVIALNQALIALPEGPRAAEALVTPRPVARVKAMASASARASVPDRRQRLSGR